MRITESAIYGTVLSNLRSNLREIDLLNYQISSGNKVRYASDDPVATHQTMWYQSDLERTGQFVKNIGEARDWLSATDGALDKAGSLLQRARLLTVQGANDTNVALDRDALAREVDQLANELLDVANLQHGSRYLFAGSDTLNGDFNDAPFQATRAADGTLTDVTYAGDQQAIYREVDEGVALQVNVLGDRVFQATNHVVTGGLTTINDPNAALRNFVGDRQGYLKLNNTNVYYDTTADSLTALVARINAAGAGVAAAVDSTTTPGAFRLQLTSTDPHQMWLRDVDRDAATAGVQGLLADLQVVDGSLTLDNGGNYTDNVHPAASEEKTTLFRALIRVRDDLRAGDSGRLNNEDLAVLDAAQENLLLMRAEVGGKLNRLEQKESRLKDYQIRSEELLSRTNDTDMAEAITQLKQFETVQQAALQAGARIFSLSLMNFLK